MHLRILIAILLAGIFATSLSAEPKWIRISTPNFEVLSSAGDRETRNTLQYFEQVRDFFLKFNGHAPKEPAPVTIVIFGSEKEFAPYSLNQSAAAYFVPRSDRDYIVMGRTGEQVEQIATHEYTHLVTQHAGLRYPPWLSEGLAELFSTFTIMNGSIAIGDPIPERILELRESQWVPLATIMAATHDSPYYNEAGKNGSLYNEGWAAVHLIGTTKEYRPKFAAFLNAVANGASSADALQSVYGKSVSAFENELRGYIAQGSFNHLVGKLEIDRSKKDVTIQSASAFDVRVALSDIDSRPTAKADRRRILEELKPQNPMRHEVWSGLAYLDWQDGNSSKAIEGFSKAYELGARSNRMLWDYGRMIQSSKAAESVKVFKELAVLEPNRAEIRIELAWSQYYAGQFNDALTTIAATKLETEDQAPRFFSALAYVQLRLGDAAAASKTVEVLKRFVKTEPDRIMFNRLTRTVDSAAASATQVPSIGVTTAPPSIATTSAPSTSPPSPGLQPPPIQPVPPGITAVPRQPFLTVSGTLAEFVCPANGSTGFGFAIDTSEGRKVFSFKDPESISIRGKEGGKVDLYCGPQNVKSRVQAEYQKSEETGIDGALKVLTFEP